MNKVYGIVAADASWGIAKDYKIPWHYPQDFKIFKKVTKGSVCIMGYNTYKELALLSKYPEKRADLLPNRTSVVLTNNHRNEVIESETCRIDSGSLLEVIKCASEGLPKFIIGGSNLYLQSLEYCEGFYVTELRKNFDCNIFFPEKEFKNRFTVDHELYSDQDLVINYWVKNNLAH